MRLRNYGRLRLELTHLFNALSETFFSFICLVGLLVPRESQIPVFLVALAQSSKSGHVFFRGFVGCFPRCR